MKIVTASQMREIEKRSDSAGVSTAKLMDNAGLAVARRVRQYLGHLVGVPILALIGPGNNGADGLIASAYLQRWGARMTAYICAGRRTPDLMLDSASAQGVSTVHFQKDGRSEQLHQLLAESHIVLDAVLGIGCSRSIAGPIKNALLDVAKESGRRGDLQVIAIDLPSGLDGDTGFADPACNKVDATVALGYPKRGFYHFPGADIVGDVEVVDIGIPKGLEADVPLDLMTTDWANGILPERPRDSHKGTFGKALMLVGSRNYVGAAALASMAAIRVGVGLVTVAVPESLRSAIAGTVREPTYLPLPESSPGIIASDAAALVLEASAGYDTLLVGCGLGLNMQTAEMLESLLLAGAPLPPVLVDADGLNLLSRANAVNPGWWTRISSPMILTPHAGEMARLRGTTVEVVEADRIRTAVESAALWGCVTVLKGAYTVVARPDGRAMVSPFANPGLSSAGTGDVLAGMIAGLMAQGLTPFDAATLGVFLHGAAGERVRDAVGVVGMIASDLLVELPGVIASLRIGD